MRTKAGVRPGGGGKGLAAVTQLAVQEPRWAAGSHRGISAVAVGTSSSNWSKVIPWSWGSWASEVCARPQGSCGSRWVGCWCEAWGQVKMDRLGRHTQLRRGHVPNDGEP